MAALKTAIIFLAVIAAANAVCCPCTSLFRCADGTHCSFGYCGYGPCNVFGCNCDGGCRGSTITGDEGATALTRFGAIDKDNNGVIDLSETKDSDRGKMLPSRTLRAEFVTADINRDGTISIEEFDKDAAEFASGQ